MSKKRVIELINMKPRELNTWLNQVPTDRVQNLLKTALIDVYMETKEGVEREIEDESFFIEEEGGTVIYREYALDAVRNYADPSIEALK